MYIVLPSTVSDERVRDSPVGLISWNQRLIKTALTSPFSASVGGDRDSLWDELAKPPFNKLNCPLTNPLFGPLGTRQRETKPHSFLLNGGCADGASHKANPGTSGRSFARAWLVLPRAARRSASSGGCRHGGFPIGSKYISWLGEGTVCDLPSSG